MATTGFKPSAARPAAKVTACCSAMATSKYLSGKRFEYSTKPEPSRIAGVMATMLGSRSAMSHSHLPKICE